MDERFGPAAMAIISGDFTELAVVLAADPDLVHTRSSVSHPTLLQFVACEAAELPDPVGAARMLVAAGAELQAPLVAAAGCGSHDVVVCLLDVGADINGGENRGGDDGGDANTNSWTPLDEALYWSNDDMARYLLGRGARIRALSTAAGLGNLTAIATCFDDDGHLTAAAGRIGSPFADTVPAHLADDPQAIIDHAFVTAVECGQQPAADELLGRGARVNAMPPGFHWRGTALHAAAGRGDRSLVDWLLARGADPTVRDGMVGADAAGWATHHGHADLAEILTSRTDPPNRH